MAVGAACSAAGSATETAHITWRSRLCSDAAKASRRLVGRSARARTRPRRGLDAVEHRQASQRGAGPSAAPAAGDLHPLVRSASPCLAQTILSVGAVGGQPEVRPADPPGFPRDRIWSFVEQDTPNSGRAPCSGGRRSPRPRTRRPEGRGKTPGPPERHSLILDKLPLALGLARTRWAIRLRGQCSRLVTLSAVGFGKRQRTD